MAKKKQHGGKRKTAGRKPIEDKKMSVVLYVRESVIDKLGLDNLKELCYRVIETNP